MKIRLFLTAICICSALVLRAQPVETIYPGTLIQAGYTNDESYGPFNIGFNFTFFGNVYSQFYVNTNGQVLFGAGSTSGDNVAIPNASLPNNFIAAFWDDLAISFTGKMLYTTIGAAPTRKLIIQFVNMDFYNIPSAFGTYLVILYENTNAIQVQYRLILDYTSTRAHGGTATIGLENANGSAGVQYSYNNSSAITNEQAISFTPAGSTYTINPDAIYDGVFLTTDIDLPDPGITVLASPAQDAVIGSSQTFMWEEASDAASYALYISGRSDLADATVYNAGSNLSYNVTGLTLDATYYWGVFATNATGTTWCEINKFTTVSIPPLAAIPQTIWIEQNQEKTIKLNYSGGDASAKTAIITTLPSQGQLFQYNGGIKGDPITSPLTTVTDAGRNVIYVANGNSGNGAGNFKFKMHDDTGDSPEAQITVNVSPPGMPNLLYTGKATTYVEMQFDLKMSNPAGKESQFAVTVNSSPATISSLTLKTGDPYTIIGNLASPVSLSDAVTIAYTAGDITAAEGGLLASFSSQTVTLYAQTITFPTNLTRKFNESPFTLSATPSSGLPMTYSSSNQVVATITGNIVTLKALGTSEITARQAGNLTWAPAKFIRTLTVTIGDQTITFGVLPEKIVGDPDFSLTATASSGLSVSYTSDNLSVATVTGNSVHITGAGTANIKASQAGNVNYNPAPDVIQPLVVNLATGVENPLIATRHFSIYIAYNQINIRTLSEEWDGNSGSVTIYNITGKTVSKVQNTDFSKSSPIMVAAPDIRGIYLVDIRSGQRKYIAKVIVR